MPLVFKDYSKKPQSYDPKALGLSIGAIMDDGKFKVRCPFHHDNNPSAIFYSKTGILKCFKCSPEGRDFYILKEILDVTNGEIIDGGEVSVIVKEEIDLKNFLKNPLAFGNEYLKERLVTDEQVEEFAIREDKENIYLTFTDGCDIIGYKARTLVGRKPKYLLFGEPPLIYPMNIDFETPAVFVEGEFGALRGRLYGYNTYAVMGAGNFRSKRFLNLLQRFKSAFILADYDVAGYEAAYRIFNKVPTNTRFLFFENCPDEMIREDWKDALNNILPSKGKIKYVLQTLRNFESINNS
jgi:DNA primase